MRENWKRKVILSCAILAATSASCRITCAQSGTEQDPAKLYDKQSAMVPMRDGIKLYTEIYRPKDSYPESPIIFLRSPYGVSNANGGFSKYFRTTFRELLKDRYIFVVQDARGRHKSEGKFEWNRPIRHRDDPKAIDASTDAFDSIEWLLSHTANNGRVGMLGVSYPGWYVTMALIDPHPALKAASPQASPSDYFIGDDFYHFGAFRLSPSAECLIYLISILERTLVSLTTKLTLTSSSWTSDPWQI